MKLFRAAVLAAALAAVPFSAAVAPAWANGDLAAKAEKLPKLVLGQGDNDFAMSVKEYKLKTGKAYNWTIVSSGMKEYGLVAPDFFRNIWLRHVAINDLEVKASGLNEVEFDGEGAMEVVFVPIRPGKYEFKIKQFADRGMVGTIVVE